MRRDGEITDADASLARAYPLRLARKTDAGEFAPYFVEWVRQLLDEQFGRQLYEQGLKVYTTLDVELQSAAERALETQMRAIEAGKYGTYKHESYEHYTAQAVDNDNENAAANSPYLQGAFIAMDPRDGSVRALIGGRNFDDSKFNRAVQALRQPGSTFKPIVYADAVQNGRPPSYILDDSPLSYTPPGGQTWEPQNYDSKFEGKMPLRRALYESRNLATIRLGMELGEASVIDEARKLGLTTPIPPYPSIHIGAASVYPIELVAAYSAFATLGTRSTPIAIVRVENQKGDVLWAPTPQRTAVLSPEEAWLMVDMMKDVVRRGTAAGTVGSVFHLPAGGKTGTTNDGTDVWFIGYTSDLIAGIWMGLDRPQKIKANAQGGVLAAPAWAAFMNQVYRRKPAPPDWPRPSGLVTQSIDITTNTLWTQGCGGVEATEYFIPGTEPTQTCAISLAPDTTGLGTPLRSRRILSPALWSFLVPSRRRDQRAPRTATRYVAVIRWSFRGRVPVTRRGHGAIRRALRPRPPDVDVRGVTTESSGPWLPVDCHAHTTFSDGKLSVDELIACARERNVKPSVSDHISSYMDSAVTTVEEARAYLDALDHYDVLRGGEFCWHDSLWREIPDDLVRRFTHRLGSLHGILLPNGELVYAFSRRFPNISPDEYMDAHVDNLERFAREMPVDILAHPTLLPLALRRHPLEELWTEAREERAVRALAAAGIAFEISNRYRPHERFVRRAWGSGARISLGSDGHTAAQVADVEFPLSLARDIGVPDEELYDPLRHGSRTGYFTPLSKRVS